MFGTSRIEDSCENAWILTLQELVAKGEAAGQANPSRELLGYDIVVKDPRNRLITHPARPLPLVPAIARFVWMMAGNNRLEDIAFYEPLVRRYTDDGLTVPGSSYGARLRSLQPGLDQVAGAIARLRGGDDRVAGADSALRRATNVIWRPEDALRQSNDIPCALALSYFPRNGHLEVLLTMRSNNAMALLPFNLFEFTLLAEVVAVEAGLELGAFRVDAMSMHLYARDDERAVQVLDAEARAPSPMPPIPHDSSPLEQVGLLAMYEAKMRHELAVIAQESYQELRSRGDQLDEWWRPLFDVLLVHATAAVHRIDVAQSLVNDLPTWLAPGAKAHLDRALARQDQSSTGQLSFQPEEQPKHAIVAQSLATTDSASFDTDHLHKLLDQIESEGHSLTRRQAHEVEKALSRRLVAARSDADGSAKDFAALTLDDVKTVLRELGFAP